ncbi:MAG: response regulator transcription factor [Allosphingosinicella sp.]
MLLEDGEASQLDLIAAAGAVSEDGAQGGYGPGRAFCSPRADAGAGEFAVRAAVCRVIAVIDDDGRVRQSLAWLLERAGYRVLPFASGDEFLASPQPERLDIVLLDIHMPGRNGLDVLRVLADRDDAPAVLILTGYGDVEMAVVAMKLNAADFLQKPCPPAALLQSVERALEAHSEVRAARFPGGNARARVDDLPSRQRQVLAGIVRGQTNKVIARELGLSVRTIEDYRAQLFARLGVRCAAEAIRIGLAAGLNVDPFATGAAD